MHRVLTFCESLFINLSQAGLRAIVVGQDEEVVFSLYVLMFKDFEDDHF